jgi:acyl-CoA hydrolase
MDKAVTLEEAVSKINSGDNIYIHSNAAAPLALIGALTARKNELKNVSIYQLITLGKAPYADIDCKDTFTVNALFIGPNTRESVNDGRANYIPVFFSEVPALFYSGQINIDVCLIQTSPPDNNGNMTLGVSVDCTPAAMANAKIIIAQVNKQMPHTYGKTKIHIDEITYCVEVDEPLPELEMHIPGPLESAIGENVATLVPDSATIQMGIGAIPNAVLRALKNKKDLGVHSEMISDGVIDLIQSGVINNKHKTVLPGKVAVSFLMGSKNLYDFVNKNSIIELHSSEFINDPYIISQNHRITSINSALQIDLTGQICADSLGTYLYSGCGGQVDFVRGASRNVEGKAIIALPSTAKGGSVSRITPFLSKGAGVVTSRADAHYIVTEYGIANLHGKSLRERTKALIDIAHPKFRASLEKESYELKCLK